ncbi:nitric oxide reductase transcriptional regulator NorR [Vibrio furnissii]|uniref:nitric oxide reductase transcriptional regulator NorR n=1 Tax=Vibrio furnissii TaxID=29494 RepID=UPI0001B91FA3|nr:nitric oxide reductase transcriptional regulator NorR [Vibrio furnissii]EEX39984.1 anaerobic nitric oxide reductase transcription regulator NorR [Vibrio furnissii CIP 102972]QDC94702.1 nitric oxide reductase transcriptional regulator NorR [Vibrio furnissii]UON50141.1 nitric oxide reductase transcriptional regulator NorR [Vibrio furnissii]SUQ32375.1 sigma-54 dependent transcriptional regulator [Vibrio furnissii]
MQDFSISTLVDMTIGLASGLNDEDRFNRLLDAVRKTIQCDCVALMSLQGDTLVPLAMQGLTRDTLGRRFLIHEHPRLDQICASTTPVRFDADSPLPDPFDGLLLDHDDDLPMHSCMGLPLIFGDKLLGVLTLDSLMPNAFEHIPLRSLEVLAAIAASTLKMALTFSQLETQAKQTQQRLEELNEEAWVRDGGEIIGSSEAMQVMKADLEVVAPSNFNILIHGETGVGKELVARTIHHLSPRKRQPLIYVNCAAIPENLVESELFGHVKGAFTGADRNRLGKFALADGGTLFLDEIGELPLAAQSKILRALQNNEIQPVGQDQVQTINVRILAATNRDLKQEVDAGRFRADLYHRLSVYPIHVPPLRERNGDVTLLAGYFLEVARRKLGIVQLKIHQQALSHLIYYTWPGNVRELEHVINRAALKARAKHPMQTLITVSAEDIGVLEGDAHTPAKAVPSAQTEPVIDLSKGLRDATDDFQRRLVSEALTQAEFNWAKAGRLLQVDRANLTRLAKRLGINVTKTHKIEPR